MKAMEVKVAVVVFLREPVSLIVISRDLPV
jgi:hypothetical protein